MTSSPRRPDAVTMTDPRQTVAALPYILGYTPERKLVAIGSQTTGTGQHAVVVTAAYDLPDGREGEFADHVAGAFTRAGVDTVALIVVDTDHGAVDAPVPHAPAVAAAVTGFAAAGITVVDAIYTDNTAVRSYGSVFPSYAADGTTITEADRDRVAAQFVAAGVNLRTGTRDDLRAEVACYATDGWGEALDQLIPTVLPDRTPDSIEQASRTVMFTLLGGTSASDPATVAAAMTDIHVRDTVLHDLAHLRADQLRTATRSLAAVVRATPDSHVPNLAATLAIAHYLTGDGARANIAVDRARGADPDHGLTALVSTALERGLPPADIRAIFEQVTRTACITGAGSSPEHAPARPATPFTPTAPPARHATPDPAPDFTTPGHDGMGL